MFCRSHSDDAGDDECQLPVRSGRLWNIKTEAAAGRQNAGPHPDPAFLRDAGCLKPADNSC